MADDCGAGKGKGKARDRDAPKAAAAAAPADTLLAVDCSGSTGGNAHYWDAVREIAQRVHGRGGRSEYILWDTAAAIVDYRALLERCGTRRGGGGTSPACVASRIVDSGFSGHLVFVTDGQVDTNSVYACDSILRARRFSFVEAHLVDTGGVVNMSCTCPFTRACPHEVTLRSRGNAGGGGGAAPAPVIQAHVDAADLAAVEAIDRIADVDTFNAKYDSLERAIAAAVMGTPGDAHLRARVLALSARLTAEAARAGAAGAGALSLQGALERRDAAAAEAATAAISSAWLEQNGGEQHAKIQVLLGYTSGALQTVFSKAEIASQRAVLAIVAPAAEVAAPADALAAEGAEVDAAAPAFECPILLDDVAADNIVLLLAAGEAPWLVGLDKPVVDALLECPLALLRGDMAPHLASLLSRCDAAVSLAAMREAEARGTPFATSPMTRAPLVRAGGLFLGSAGAHADATDAALFEMLAGRKRLGSPDLWYAAIALGLAATPGRFADVVPAVTRHLQWRLRHRYSYASLSGLANVVTTRMTLGAAVWFCYGGCAAQDAVMPRREALRIHLGYAHALGELVGLSGHPVTPRAARHLARLRVLSHMLRVVKHGAGAAALRNDVAALWQASIELSAGGDEAVVAGGGSGGGGGGASVDACDELLSFDVRAREVPYVRRVLVDGPANPDEAARVLAKMPAAYAALPHCDLAALVARVDASLAAGDVGVGDLEAHPPAPPVAVRAWASYDACGGGGPEIEIVPATMRPRYQLTRTRTWLDSWRESYGGGGGGGGGGEERPALSFTRHFMVFAGKYGRLPTRTDFLCYMAHRLPGGVAQPLPAPALAWFESDRACYARALGVPAASIADGAVAFGGVAALLKRFNASVKILDRIELEAAERAGHPPPRLPVLAGAKNAGFYFGEGVAPEPPTPTPDGSAEL